MDFAILGNLTSVVHILLLGYAGSLTSGAHILSGLREDFLWGVGKLTRSTSQREGIFSSRGWQAFACKESACRRTGEDKRRNSCDTHKGGLWGVHAEAALALVDMNQTCEEM